MEFELQGNYRKRNRWIEWDYSSDGYYFITICTQNREEYFGEIKNGEMILNAYGQIVQKQWFWLGEQYKYIKLDEFIIMPNHVHGIIVIDNGIIGKIGTINIDIYHRRHNLLSKTINAFKMTSSKLIHENKLAEFKWQRSFYDHIIRDKKSLNNIRQYIINNPMKWFRDRNNKEDLYY